MTESLPALKVQLDEWKDEQRRCESNIEKAGRNRTGGLLGIVGGGVLLWMGFTAIGVILLLAGILATITAYSKIRSETKRLTEINNHIRSLRYKVADMEE